MVIDKVQILCVCSFLLEARHLERLAPGERSMGSQVLTKQKSMGSQEGVNKTIEETPR